MWGLAFKPRTDDMREAPAVPLIKGLLAAGADVHAYDPEAMNVAQGHLRHARSTYAENSYAALTGADALVIVTEWNEFREPDYARMKKLMRERGHLRRPQHLQPGTDSRAGFHVLLDGAPVSAVLVTGGAGYIGSHAVKALRGAASASSIYDNLSAGHRRGRAPRRRRRAELVEGDIHDTDRVRRTIDGARDRRGHALRGVAVGGRFGAATRPATIATTSCGALSVLDAMIAAGVRHFVFSRRPRCSAIRRRRRSPRIIRKRPINAYGETKLAIERALPHYDRAYGLRSVALRYFNAAGADPDGELGEDHDPELHVIPARDRRGARPRDVPGFGDDYDTPDGTCLRDYVHVTDLAQAHVLALDALRGGAASTVYNLGNGRPTSVRDILHVGRAGHRPAGAVHRRPAPRRRSAVLFASSDAHPPRAGLGAAVRGRRHHRRDGLAVARGASAGLSRGGGAADVASARRSSPIRCCRS